MVTRLPPQRGAPEPPYLQEGSSEVRLQSRWQARVGCNRTNFSPALSPLRTFVEFWKYKIGVRGYQAEVQRMSRPSNVEVNRKGREQLSGRKERVGFHTGLHAIDYSNYPAFPYKGAGWHIDLLPPDPDKHATSMVRGDESFPARELAVFAKEECQAQKAADLIHSARLLLDGSNVMSHLWPGEHPAIWPMNKREKGNAEDSLETHWQITTVHLPLASLIAAKASWRMEFVYALAKLRVSFEISSVPAKHLDPTRNDNFPKSGLPEDHVRLAHALIAAWSCIEELGFEVRASAQKPSKLPDGGWNPPVKADLERRLRRGGVDLAGSFPWNLRGPRTRIERKRPPQIFSTAEWARWNVRDGEMLLIDAINYASFMRSSIAAHKSDPRMISVLSIYDVANVQLLARRLILEKMDFWRSNERTETHLCRTVVQLGRKMGAKPRSQRHKLRDGW